MIEEWFVWFRRNESAKGRVLNVKETVIFGSCKSFQSHADNICLHRKENDDGSDGKAKQSVFAFARWFVAKKGRPLLELMVMFITKGEDPLSQEPAST